MKKNNEKLIFLVLISFIFTLTGLFLQGSAESITESKQSVKISKKTISALELPIPQSEQDKAYLGLEGTGTFKLNQIKTRILIIEVLNSYCPHCQNAAHLVNNLYLDMEKRFDLKGKIKIIGIGVGDSPDEINVFKKDYQVIFPLLSDQNGESADTFGVEGTPTFIGIRLNDQGFPEKFFFQEGGFGNAPNFLKKIIKRSGIN